MVIHSPRILSLCTGIGGLELGIELACPGARTVCCVEREAFAAATLVARMEEQALDQAPVWDDLLTFDGQPWRGKVDLITGGYPCQPFSVAGKMRGKDDPRHLWPHITRVVREVSPSACFFENVPNHLNLGFKEVCEDLWRMGFRVEAGIYSAAEIGAPHLRKRLFILAAKEGVLADSNGTGQQGKRSGGLSDKDPERRDNPDRQGGSNVANPNKSRRKGRSRLEQATEKRQTSIKRGHDTSGCDHDVANTKRNPIRIQPGRWCGESWPSSPFPPGPGETGKWEGMPDSLEPSIRRDSDGLSSRVDRLRCLGNAVVPQVACLAWSDLWRKMRVGA